MRADQYPALRDLPPGIDGLITRAGLKLSDYRRCQSVPAGTWATCLRGHGIARIGAAPGFKCWTDWQQAQPKPLAEGAVCATCGELWLRRRSVADRAPYEVHTAEGWGPI